MANTTLPALLENENVKGRFLKVLNQNAPAFISTVLTVWNGNAKLQECDAKSILRAALLSATLNLPLNPSLGLAYIVPYKGQAQFQIGWKGFLQLALDTHAYQTLHSGAVREGEITGVDVITGELIKGEKVSDKIVGYVAFMRLNSGFEKAEYMTVEEIQEHAQKYSQSYAYDLRSGKKSSVWTTNFDAMAKKTVLKKLINHWGLIATNNSAKNSKLARALQVDQATVNGDGISYIDNDGRKVPLENYDVLDEVPFDTQSESETQTVDAETGEILTA